MNCNSLVAQRKRVLKALEESAGGLTTIELREQHDCMSPAPRIFELRHHYGKRIETNYSYDFNAQGNGHRVARYVLLTANS